ncbi:MAG TPA: SpoIIE family protein phosphatase, partial [Acidimicrobiales bacterium]|nr:SpoIIE family protein phosphatase [Acidimicrobiales bacterium]
TEVTLSPITAGDVSTLVAVIRPRDDAHLSRWSELTATLFDILGDTDSGRSADQQLLQALGRQLDFELTTLWALTPLGDLRLREVWSDPIRDPGGRRLQAARALGSTSEVTLPYYALRSGAPLWIPDLAADPRFTDGPAAKAGLTTAVVFPVEVAGLVVGVVELFSAERRPGDPELVELVRAVSRPAGELLGALEQAADQQRLVRELAAARQRQDFVLRASRVVSQIFDYATALQQLAEVAVPILGDLCLIDVVDADGHLARKVAHHRDPAKAELLAELHEFGPDPTGSHPAVDVLRARRSRWSADMTDEFLRATTRNERHYEVVKALGVESYMSVPLLAGDRTLLGSLTLVSAGSHRHFDAEDLRWAEQLASQVASVLDRAGRYERERSISHTFQRNLLPARLPQIEGLQLAARYLPATRDVEVGGDWYDVVTEGTRVALVVGDVEGHDLQAASAMGTLRFALSAFLSEHLRPGESLLRLNRFALRSRLERLATALVVAMDGAAGEVVIASAGHLPPVLRTPAGVTLATISPAAPLGVDWDEIDEVTIPFPTGDVVAFTDGLVERPPASLSDGLEALVAAVRSGPSAPEAMCDHLLAALLPGGERLDDVALVVGRTTGGK